MKHDEFIKHVQSAAQFNSREEAEHATRATLEALKASWEMKQANWQHNCPRTWAVSARARGENGHFRLEEFIQRVSEKEGVEPTAARNHARAVFAFATSDTR